MPTIQRQNIINTNDHQNPISITMWNKQNKHYNNLAKIDNEKSSKYDPLTPYMITVLCILIVLSIIFALVIYILNRKSTSHKSIMIDYKSPAFKLFNGNEQGSSINEYSSDKSEKNEAKSCWFNFGTLKQALNDFTLPKESKQKIIDVNKKNSNNLLIKEIQPTISKEESFYLGGPNTLAFSPQSIGSLSGYSHVHRAKNKGLLESRRGSRTSLTLSLSPSIDSMSSTRSPSPTRTDVENDKYILENNSLNLTIEDLKSRVSSKSEILFQEFWDIPMNHTTKGEFSVFGTANKNRYKSILPNECTRVILPQINDNFLSTYINANYIRDYRGSRNFIATQGPMPQTIIDFWRLVWHVEASAIVMLTKLTENNKRKCEYYLPNDMKNGQMFGNIFVTIMSTTAMEGFTERKLVVKKGNASFLCSHLWFTSWPDHGSPTPQTTHDLLSLVETLDLLKDPDPSVSERPVIVHCSAGLGRTGCFIALCNGCAQLQLESQVDVLGIVSRMRLDRGGMINNNEQYEFLHRALLQFVGRHGLSTCDNNGNKKSKTDHIEDDPARD